MKKLLRYIYMWIVWFFYGFRIYWFLVLVLFTPLIIVVFVSQSPDDWLRYIGLLFQLLGIVAVVCGLRDRWKLFHRPIHFDELLKQYPRWPQKSIQLSSNASSISTCTASLSDFGWHLIPTDGDIDAHVKVLEKNVESLKIKLFADFQRIDEKINKLNTELQLDRQGYKKENEVINTTLNKFGAGGLHSESVGVYFLFLGVIFSTIPHELVLWISNTIT